VQQAGLVGSDRKKATDARARKSAQTQAFEAVMGLEVRESHLNLLSLIARSKECLGLHLAAREVAGVFVHIAYDPARGHAGAASRLEHA